MTHGYIDHAAHEIALRLDRHGSDLALEIQDDGPAFDPRLVEELQPATSLEEARVGGWGIPLCPPLFRRITLSPFRGTQLPDADFSRAVVTTLMPRPRRKPRIRPSLPSPVHAERASPRSPADMASNSQVPVIDPQAITAAHAALASSPALPDAPGVDKIRELLFGNQMQDYDRRFGVLEERFQQRLRDVEGESSRALGSMESSIKKQLESIAGQVRQEQELRAEAVKELGQGLRELMQGLRSGLVRSPTGSPAVEREFTERIGHESQALRDDMRRRNEDTRATIERMFQELSNVKTDRNLLAGLFVEIARCLNQDTIPRAGKGNGANS